MTTTPPPKLEDVVDALRRFVVQRREDRRLNDERGVGDWSEGDARQLERLEALLAELERL